MLQALDWIRDGVQTALDEAESPSLDALVLWLAHSEAAIRESQRGRQMSPNIKEAMLQHERDCRNIVELAAGDDREDRIELAKRQLHSAMIALERIQGKPQAGPVYAVIGDADGWGA
jgi:hypothetical protein